MIHCCEALLSRVSSLPDQRSREVVTQGLQWAARHPTEILYNTPTSADAKSVMPNVVGFQSVLTRIAARRRALGVRRVSVVIDRQSQFNSAQKSLAAGTRVQAVCTYPWAPECLSLICADGQFGR